MLAEHFITSIGGNSDNKVANNAAAKDAAIFVHELQPLTRQQSIFKKSATPPNSLAISQDHIFAAQAGKAVVHVYSREKGNQEATVPFTERITCVALACDDSVLVLGTDDGRIFLWEVASGRQVTTAQSHLQTVTALAVDPTSNFLLSTSADSTVHVWSVPSLISFSNVGTQALAPLQTFTGHRAEVSAVSVGHSKGFCNIAATLSKDKTCLVWDYHSNSLLRTYLLPAVPVSIALDAADRAVYAGYEDGSVQQLDLYAQEQTVHDSYDPTAPVQSRPKSHWKPSDASVGAALSLDLSFDGCTLLSGHQSGVILAWDVATGRHRNNILQNPLPGPITNLAFLAVSGFSHQAERTWRMQTIVKPKFGAFDSGDGSIPGNYAVHAEFTSDLELSSTAQSAFQQALTDTCFSQSLIDEGLSELATWGKISSSPANGQAENESEDFMALDSQSEQPHQVGLEQQNLALKKQIAALRRLQSASFEKMEKIKEEKNKLVEREQTRLFKAQRANGVAIGTLKESDEVESMQSDDESD